MVFWKGINLSFYMLGCSESLIGSAPLKIEDDFLLNEFLIIKNMIGYEQQQKDRT